MSCRCSVDAIVDVPNCSGRIFTSDIVSLSLPTVLAAIYIHTRKYGGRRLHESRNSAPPERWGPIERLHDLMRNSTCQTFGSDSKEIFSSRRVKLHTPPSEFAPHGIISTTSTPRRLTHAWICARRGPSSDATDLAGCR